MEALGLPALAFSTSHQLKPRKLSSTASPWLRSCYPFSSKAETLLRIQHMQHCSVKMVANDTEEVELKQMREMSAAKKRWDALIGAQKIKVLTPKEAGYAIQLSNTSLLDVRPSIEYDKARVKRSAWIPIFDVDKNFNIGNISKNIANFAMGGWWSGSPILFYNDKFVSQVVEKFPKDAELIVTCQKGLRSLAACEQLYIAGYGNLFWVQGGLEAAEDEDFEREGPLPFIFAGIGGLSEFLGWTDQQRFAASKEGIGYRLVFTGRLIGLIVLFDGLFIGAQQIGHYIQELRSH